MASPSRTVRVKFDGDARGLANAAKSGEKQLGGVEKAMKKGVVAAGLLGAGLLAAAPKILGAAANLQLLGKKSSIVFGDQLGSVQAWASKSAQAMGLTTRQAVGLAAGFADLLVPMGFTRQEAAKMSTETVGLAGALAEWSGGTKTAAEVTDILQAAFLGERDGLQALGISISQAEVDAALLAKGQQDLTGKQRQQAEATATQALIFDKSRDAQTAYANGSDSLARKLSEAKARVREMAEDLLVKATPALSSLADTVVDDVVPALTKGVDFIVKVVGALADLPGPLKAGSLAFTGFSLVASAATLLVGKAVATVKNIKTAFMDLSRAGKGLTLSLGGVGLVLAAAAAVYSVFAKRNADAKQEVADLRSTLDEQTGAITGNTRAYVANELVQKGLADKAKALHLSLPMVTDAILGNKGAMDALTKSLDATIAAGTKQEFQGRAGATSFTAEAMAAKQLKEDLLGTNGALAKAQAEQKLAAEAAAGGATAQDKVAAATQKATQKVADQKKALGDAIEELHNYSNALLALRGGEVGYEASVDSATESIKENGRTLDIHTEKGRNNRTALDQIATSANTLTDEMLKNGKSHSEVATKAEAARAKYVKLAMQMGLSRADAERLARSLIDIPKKTETDFKADITDLDSKIKSAKEKLKDPDLTKERRAKLNADIASLLAKKKQAQAAIDALHGKTVPITITVGAKVNSASVRAKVDAQLARLGADGTRAAGGPVSAGRSYLVGEKGPEVVTFGANGNVTPNHQLGGGPTYAEIHIEIGGEVQRVVRTEMKQQNRDLKRTVKAGG